MSRGFRSTGLLTVGVFLVIIAEPTHADRLRNIEIGATMPPFSCPGLDGEPVTSETAAGKALMLVYLSAQQKQSEEAMEAAHRIAGNISNDKLALIYMSADTDQADYFRQLRDRVMAHEPFALDAERAYYGRVGLIVFPTTAIVSPGGRLLHVLAGWNRDYEYQANLFCRHALGELDDADLAERLKRRPEARDDARAKADRHRSAAAILRAKGMEQGAIDELKQALVVDPDCADAVVDLADVLVEVGKIDEAEKRINELLARQPDFHRAKLVLGLIQLKRDKLDAARELLTEALVMNPDPIRAHYYLGQLCEKEGDYKAAAEHYRQALERSLGER